MVGDSMLLRGYDPFATPHFVALPDGNKLLVAGVGTLEVGEKFHVPDVYAVDRGAREEPHLRRPAQQQPRHRLLLPHQ
ncbi:hypothetical protein ACP70R_008108 [Stipagrostis hirtigluma subsp. patula]